MTRALIVVDCETTDLTTDAHIVEIAAINVTTGEELYFVPYISRHCLADASPEALQINRYYERGVFKDMLDQEATHDAYLKLQSMLTFNTFGGSNPRFDAQLVERAPRIGGVAPIGAVWHHRLADVSAYACGALGLDPAEPPGLADLCNTLGVTNPDEHSALGDAKATVECFRRLRDIARRE
jgi:DNA polymerase-3 subunit epsilon